MIKKEDLITQLEQLIETWSNESASLCRCYEIGYKQHDEFSYHHGKSDTLDSCVEELKDLLSKATSND